MKRDTPIRPEKITKPIQLLAAWLAGLFSVDTCFLFAASQMEAGSFESISLVIAAIINVPLFLAAVFILQTKFRPELQEDSYYSTYLNQKTNKPVEIKKNEVQFIEISKRLEIIENLIEKPAEKQTEQPFIFDAVDFGINVHLKNRAEIRHLLSAYNVQGTSSFGVNNPPPENSVVAISEYLPREVAHEVIEVAKQVGMKHYTYFDKIAEEIEEDVLFGGYGEARYEIA